MQTWILLWPLPSEIMCRMYNYSNVDAAVSVKCTAMHSCTY